MGASWGRCAGSWRREFRATVEGCLPGFVVRQGGQLVHPRLPQPDVTTPALTAAQSQQQLAVQEQPKKQTAKQPTAGELISRSLQIASASAEVQQRQQDKHGLLFVPPNVIRYGQVVDVVQAKGLGQCLGDHDQRVRVVALSRVEYARDAALLMN